MFKTKLCTNPKCKRRKLISEFSKRSDTNGLKSWCKTCIRKQCRDKYHRNKEYYRLRSQIRTKRIRTFIQKEKDKPCNDCGNLYPYYVMDFDHRPDETKVFAVSLWMKQNCGIDAIKKEISKCDVVCSNCHRIRTHSRKLLTNV